MDWLDGLEYDTSAPISVARPVKQFDSWQSPNGMQAQWTGRDHSQAKAESNPTTYRDKCLARNCNRGSFVSYSGRIVGKCFACKGLGYKEFKSSPESRAASKEMRDTKKTRNEAENLAFFGEKYPEIMAWILATQSFEFAVSMLANVKRTGELTEGQIAACERCIERNKTRKVEALAKIESAPIVLVDKLMEAFESAKANKAKRPILRFESFQASLAPSTGVNAGAIYIKSNSDVYLGKIQNGKFFARNECSEEQTRDVTNAMRDPVNAAIAYGKKNRGTEDSPEYFCACCGIQLTNPESIARGIGPICADKFGF